MKCPIGDGQLVAHTTQGENNLTVSYSTCPVCNGYWMESFAANFVTLPPENTFEDKYISNISYSCPVCAAGLVRATGENTPDSVMVYTCRDSHGYFFPQGQLAAFKKAQQTKIAYHKLWNIPLPSVRSVLLTGLLIAILTGGFVAAYIGVQNRQTTTSQAHELLASEGAYVNAKTHEVLITAQTDFATTLTITIPTFNNFQQELDSDDSLLHTLTVKNIPAGSYQYYFTLQFLGESVQSKTYSFVMPQ